MSQVRPLSQSFVVLHTRPSERRVTEHAPTTANAASAHAMRILYGAFSTGDTSATSLSHIRQRTIAAYVTSTLRRHTHICRARSPRPSDDKRRACPLCRRSWLDRRGHVHPVVVPQKEGAGRSSDGPDDE